MQRIALGFAAWSVLLLAITGLAVLASPPSGPPMPRSATVRTTAEALVPERDVRAESTRRPPRPEALSGTVAPATSSESGPPSGGAPSAAEPAKEPASAPAAGAAPGQTPGETPRAPRRPQDEGSVPGLGVLPAGVPAEEEGFGLHVQRSDGRPAIDATVRWLLQRDLDASRARPAAGSPC